MIQFKITEKFMDIAVTALFFTMLVGIPLFFISKCTYNDFYPSEQILREKALEDSLDRVNDSLETVHRKNRVLFVDTASKSQLLKFGVDVKAISCFGGYDGYDNKYLCRFTKSYDLGKLYTIVCTERLENVLMDCNTGEIKDISESINNVQQLPDAQSVTELKQQTQQSVDTNAVQN